MFVAEVILASSTYVPDLVNSATALLPSALLLHQNAPGPLNFLHTTEANSLAVASGDDTEMLIRSGKVTFIGEFAISDRKRGAATVAFAVGDGVGVAVVVVVGIVDEVAFGRAVAETGGELSRSLRPQLFKPNGSSTARQSTARIATPTTANKSGRRMRAGDRQITILGGFSFRHVHVPELVSCPRKEITAPFRENEIGFSSQ